MRPSAPMKRKAWGQPKRKVIQPMIGANRTVAKYCAALKIADAVPRSVAGNQAATRRALPGKEGASARPTRKRNANRNETAADAPKAVTVPCAAVKIDQSVMPAR